MRIIFWCAWLCLNGAIYNNAMGGDLKSAVLNANDGIMAEQFIPVSEAALPLGEFLSLDTNHLFALGLGILVGVAVIAPQLEAGELTGVIVGVIGGDLLYRTVFAPSKHDWFSEGWF